MNICEHLTVPARLFPKAEALVFEGRRFSYAELYLLSIRAADLLRQAGITPGDRVAIMLPNVPSFVVWYYAILRLGGVALSISTRSVADEVAFVISDSGARALVADANALAAVAGALEFSDIATFDVSEDGSQCNDDPLPGVSSLDATWIDAEPHDPALILYTSGTTGVPKGATLSHGNVRSNVHAFNHLCGMNSGDRILLAVPLFHCFGQNALLNSALNVGATLVLQRSFDLAESKQLIATEQVTQLYGVPTMFQLFHESCTTEDLASVQYCFSAAAPLPLQVSENWLEKFGMPINEGYGLTETSPFASYNHALKYVAGSIGTPIDNVQMRIIDHDTGKPCPPGELGEIAIRGPNVMLGYWNRPEETAEVLRDGWFHSGDIGREDQDGFFHIVDRLKDMIAVGGLKVYPAEVERVLLDHPEVAEVAVVGLPDEIFGEQVVAFIVPGNRTNSDNQAFASSVKEYGQDHLSNYKAPRKVVVLDRLPRNPSGKVLKKELREQHGAVHMAESQHADLGFSENSQKLEPLLRPLLARTHKAAWHRETTHFIQQMVRSISPADELPAPEARFLDIGLDSLMIVEVSNQLQAEVGRDNPLPATLVFDYPRIVDLADFLVETFTAETENKKVHDTTSASAIKSTQFQAEVESMTEDEAYQELMRELGKA